MARMPQLPCCAAAFLTVAMCVGWLLPVTEPAATIAVGVEPAFPEAPRARVQSMPSGSDAEPGVAPKLPSNELPDTLQGDPEHLERLLRRVVAFHDDGTLRGMRVYPGSNEQAFEASGLEAGDLIIAVEGELLVDPARASEILDLVGHTTSTTVVVERREVRMEIILWFPSPEPRRVAHRKDE